MLNKAISALISSVLIILLTVFASGMVLTIGGPSIQRAQDSGVINEGMQNMHTIDDTIREVASEGSGSFRTIQLKITEGQYFVNNKTNSIEFSYKIKSNILEPGTLVKDGNLVISSSINAKASTYDLDGDGQNELVIENELIRVGMQSVDSRSSPTSINTSSIIKLLNFKQNDANVTPSDSSVILDSFEDSYYGTGFSELVRTGDHLAKAEALVHVNSTSITYDVVYSLPSGADFLIVRVQNAQYN